MQPEIFWGLTVAAWTAIGAIATIALALATIGVAWVAGYQIAAARTEAAAARAEAKKTRTLEIVSKYDHDPVLDRALRRMARARDAKLFYVNVHDYRMDLFAVLNYLETIAIGLQQGLFIEAMVRDFMEPIVKSHINEVMREKLFEKLGADPDDFGHICALNESWKPKSAMHFKETGT
jgi:hypothetical protein